MFLRSFGKINIGLRILSKRDDGFHDIETIFYPVKLCDEIKIFIVPTKKDHNSVYLDCNKSFLPLTKENICYKAIENFFVAFRIKEHFEIKFYIKKNIPVGGGLGGGSSNAAWVLKFLIGYFKINIPENRKTILDIALSLGSDVPFFLINKPCLAEGRGEMLKLLNEFKIDYNILILNPNLHVSTKWAYENLNFQPGLRREPVLLDVNNFDTAKADLFGNDFENVVFKKYMLLKELKDELISNGALFSSMSGSGATLYGFFRREDDELLNKIYSDYKRKGYFVFISKAA
jgi:4-diphosphocytidyl-2-C-methyl-D-erythritol kinase